MDNLTFGEQVKIMLGRKGMTIKELAEIIEERTGKKMSRQNLTQRLGRDNFQEQDMRMIANILGCSFQLNILSTEPPASIQEEKKESPTEQEWKRIEMKRLQKTAERHAAKQDVKQSEVQGDDKSEERDMTIGELYSIHEELSELESKELGEEPVISEPEKKKDRFITGGIFLRKKAHVEQDEDAKQESAEALQAEHVEKEIHRSASKPVATGKEQGDDNFEPVLKDNDVEEDLENGEVNPYTGREYQSNSVRMHPSRIGYVQVYDRSIHRWTDMTEWAFLGYQERKKALMGKEYEPPIYLD